MAVSQEKNVLFRVIIRYLFQMCGIVGAFVFNNGAFRVTEPYIASMRNTMAHRGPDGSGVWIDPGGSIGLGHRRLSIIDLSESASQPMCNEDGSL